MTAIENGLLRTAAFRAAEGYPPSFYEWIAQAEVPRESNLIFVEEIARRLIQEGRIKEARGRIVLPDFEEQISRHEERRALFHAKIRKARRVAAWLARQRSVRFVALCNTTAIAHAREDSDLDFFIIVKKGAIWQSRFLSVLPYKLMRKRPGDGKTNSDAVCLSFFVDETALSLEALQLSRGGQKQDPYLRYWLLSLLPLLDDGVSEQFWNENEWLREKHGLATKWMPHPDFRVQIPKRRIPHFQFVEDRTRKIQKRAFPKGISESINQGSHVIVSDRMLKFHTTDRREQFRENYERICRTISLSP